MTKKSGNHGVEEGVTRDSVFIEVLKKAKLFQQGADKSYPYPEFGEITKELGNRGHVPCFRHSHC